MNDNLSSVEPLENCLFAGVLDGNSFKLKPVVQVFDVDTFLNLILVHDGKNVYEVKYIARFPRINIYSVVRFDEYSIHVTQKGHVITVTNLTILRDGSEIEQNIAAGEDWSKVERFRPNQTRLLLRQLDSIASLDPYYGSAWTIEALVIHKIPIQTWNKPESSGYFFKTDLRDSSGEIRMTFFNDECHRFFDQIQAGKTYRISGGRFQLINRTYNNLNHSYEIIASINTVIEESRNVCGIPLSSDVKYMSFEEISQLSHNSLVNTIGVVEDICKFRNRCILRITDITRRKLSVVLSHNSAQTFTSRVGQIVTFQGIRTDKINEHLSSLASVMTTRFEIDPEIPEARCLHDWYQANVLDQHDQLRIVSDNNAISCISELTTSPHGNDAQSQSIQILATVINIQLEKCNFFKSCANSQCAKKLLERSSGVFWCHTCKRTSVNFCWNLVARIQLADVTQSVWVSVSNKHVEQLLARTVDFIFELISCNPCEFRKLVNSSLFQTHSFLVTSSNTEGYTVNEISSGNHLSGLIMKNIDNI